MKLAGGAREMRKLKCLATGVAILSLSALALPAQFLQAQSAGQSQSQPATGNPDALPDAPSAVQPPPKTELPATVPPPPGKANEQDTFPGDTSKQPDVASDPPSSSSKDRSTPPSYATPDTPTGAVVPRNQLNPKDDLLTLHVNVNFVQIPVMVKDSNGHRVDGLLPKDFTVRENGKPQTLTFFTSDPWALSVAIVLDTGMADVALQKVNQTYSALIGAFGPYDEVALYTYSSTVSQVSDFTGKPERLAETFNQVKQMRGQNGPPVLGGPLGPGGPTVNGAPVGTGGVEPVNTPARESHVLNDAILRAALDLSKHGRDDPNGRSRRKIIFVISDGRELGSRAGYRDVLHLLETRNIEVRAVVVDSGALPGFRQLGKLHLPGQGINNILPKYVAATSGEADLERLTRNSIEDAYAEITNDARNQYTLGYSPKPITTASAYRSVEVLVDKKGLKVAAMDGYFAVPTAH